MQTQFGPLRLEWPGRRWQPGERARGASRPVCRTVEVSAEGASGACRLVRGDALDVADALAAEGLEGNVDLVYVDPPFASQAEYVHEARIDGPADGRVLRATAYDDRWGGADGVGAYLDMLAPRLEAAARLLAPAGTLWVHVDWRASYLVRILLDELLGRRAFINEIVWRRAPNLGRQAASHQFGRTLDTLVVYGREHARLVPPTRLEPIDRAAVRRDEQGRPFTAAPRGDYTDESIARLEGEGRVHRTASGKVYIKYFLVQDPEGRWCRERRVDALWTDVAPLRHAPPSERTGFPTQKPRALLDRIIACASPPDGTVVDLFSGSGTTGESAHALGRKVILGDVSALAIATSRARLVRAGAALTVQECATERTPSADQERADPGEGVHCAMHRAGRRVRLELRAPAEPLAWAVDRAHRVGEPFRVAWHAERSLGPKTKGAAREITLDDAPGPVAVRVWYDDGRVGTQIEEPA
jgi:site-specific DNA-methyltransferase (adenine-specific)/adenine-specific DNA-methyltransferase